MTDAEDYASANPGRQVNYLLPEVLDLPATYCAFRDEQGKRPPFIYDFAGPIIALARASVYSPYDREVCGVRKCLTHLLIHRRFWEGLVFIPLGAGRLADRHPRPTDDIRLLVDSVMANVIAYRYELSPEAGPSNLRANTLHRFAFGIERVVYWIHRWAPLDTKRNRYIRTLRTDELFAESDE